MLFVCKYQEEEKKGAVAKEVEDRTEEAMMVEVEEVAKEEEVTVAVGKEVEERAMVV